MFGFGACIQFLPIVIYVCYASTLVCVGVHVLIEEEAIREQACDKAYPLWTYCCVNVVLYFTVTLTYCVWRGGGESARGRATALIVVYFALFMWGLLMGQAMTTQCDRVFNQNFEAIFVLYEVFMDTNIVFFFLFTVHEAFLGKHLGSDYTIMAHLKHRYNAQLGSQASPRLIPLPQQDMHGVSLPQGNITLPPQNAMLPPQLKYDYDKIVSQNRQKMDAAERASASTPMQGRCATRLPQNTP